MTTLAWLPSSRSNLPTWQTLLTARWSLLFVPLRREREAGFLPRLPSQVTWWVPAKSEVPGGKVAHLDREIWEDASIRWV